jgi:hypothetical protein
MMLKEEMVFWLAISDYGRFEETQIVKCDDYRNPTIPKRLEVLWSARRRTRVLKSRARNRHPVSNVSSSRSTREDNIGQERGNLCQERVSRSRFLCPLFFYHENDTSTFTRPVAVAARFFSHCPGPTPGVALVFLVCGAVGATQCRYSLSMGV